MGIFFTICDNCGNINIGSDNMTNIKCKRCNQNMLLKITEYNPKDLVDIYHSSEEERDKWAKEYLGHPLNKVYLTSTEQNVVRCQYCNSTNVKKILTTSRTLHTSFLGLGSSKIGKQWHCNHCGSDF